MLNALLKTFKSTLKTKLSHFPPKTSILPNEQAVTGGDNTEDSSPWQEDRRLFPMASGYLLLCRHVSFGLVDVVPGGGGRYAGLG